MPFLASAMDGVVNTRFAAAMNKLGGLAIRVLGDVTGARLAILGKADLIMREEIESFGWYSKIFALRK